MRYDWDSVRELAIQTFRDPRGAARALINDPPPREAIWLLVALQGVAVGILLVLTGQSTGGVGSMLLAPVAAVASVLISTVILTEAGRVFGGTGRFADVLLTSVWVSLLNLVITGVEMGIDMVIPGLGGLLQLVLFFVTLWIAVAMLQEVHGFASPWPALGVYVLAGVVLVGLLLLLGAGALMLNGTI